MFLGKLVSVIQKLLQPKRINSSRSKIYGMRIWTNFWTVRKFLIFGLYLHFRRRFSVLKADLFSLKSFFFYLYIVFLSWPQTQKKHFAKDFARKISMCMMCSPYTQTRPKSIWYLLFLTFEITFSKVTGWNSSAKVSTDNQLFRRGRFTKN